MFERCYFFLRHCRLSSDYAMFQGSILSIRIWGAQAVVRGARPPWPPRSDGNGGNLGKSRLKNHYLKQAPQKSCSLKGFETATYGLPIQSATN